MHDVIVERVDNGELIAVSRKPGVFGEPVVMEFPAAEMTTADVHARIADSQPVVINGTVRHRLRLQTTGGAAPRSDSV